jgi:hypothetical protein
LRAAILRQRPPSQIADARAFSSEVDTGSRQENAIYPDALKSREKFLAVSDWTDSDARVIQSGFLSEENGHVTLSDGEREKPDLHFQAAATAVRHVSIAATRKVRCVRAEVRWRWT